MPMSEALKAIKPQREEYPSWDEHAAALRQWIRDCATMYDIVTDPLHRSSQGKVEFLAACGVGGNYDNGKD